MNDAERQALPRMRDCWTTGGAAASLAPAEWLQMVTSASAGERERLLLAIAGQAFDVAFRPAAPKTLTIRPALPKLALPGVPERLRPLFRSALKVAKATRSERKVVAVAEARGFVAHPLDWMPAASDLDVSPAYAPWVDWQAKASARQYPATTLSAATWDDFLPSERRSAIADVRRKDPAAARALLEARAGAESAEVRVRLIELLETNLSAEDAPYLQSLSTDRSSNVRQLAARLLARVGRHATTDESETVARELADFIERSRSGVVRRRTVYASKSLKSFAQVNRRNELFAVVQLIDLAKALGTTEREFVEGWQLGGTDGMDHGLVRMARESGSDDAVQALGTRLIEVGDAVLLSVLLPRLDKAARRSLIAIVLSRDAEHTVLLDIVPDSEVCTFDRHELMTSTLYVSHRATIADRTRADRTPQILALLGCLATREAADAIIADLTAAGLGHGDPALALLRLNAALVE